MGWQWHSCYSIQISMAQWVDTATCSCTMCMCMLAGKKKKIHVPVHVCDAVDMSYYCMGFILVGLVNWCTRKIHVHVWPSWELSLPNSTTGRGWHSASSSGTFKRLMWGCPRRHWRLAHGLAGARHIAAVVTAPHVHIVKSHVLYLHTCTCCMVSKLWRCRQCHYLYSHGVHFDEDIGFLFPMCVAHVFH